MPVRDGADAFNSSSHENEPSSEFSRFRGRGLDFVKPQDYQFISTPAFSRDRGQCQSSVKAHWEF
jgi:hypothetical protein